MENQKTIGRNHQEDAIWALIEKENKRDRIIKRISKIGWGLTLFVLFSFLVITIIKFIKTYQLYIKGLDHFQSVINTLFPFLIILGTIALIIAILATIGMFLRLRTTNLLEIQQRLTALEAMLREK